MDASLFNQQTILTIVAIVVVADRGLQMALNWKRFKEAPKDYVKQEDFKALISKDFVTQTDLKEAVANQDIKITLQMEVVSAKITTVERGLASQATSQSRMEDKIDTLLSRQSK